MAPSMKCRKSGSTSCALGAFSTISCVMPVNWTINPGRRVPGLTRLWNEPITASHTNTGNFDHPVVPRAQPCRFSIEDDEVDLFERLLCAAPGNKRPLSFIDLFKKRRAFEGSTQ